MRPLRHTHNEHRRTPLRADSRSPDTTVPMETALGRGRLQIITLTFRHIGNVGASDRDVESWEKVDAVSKPVWGLAHPQYRA